MDEAFNSVFATGGANKLEYNDGNDEDMFGGAIREGYDSYGIYDPSTKKTVGRYISKTPINAAMKAARRVFFPIVRDASGKVIKSAKGKAAKAKKVPKAKGKKGGDGDDVADNYGGGRRGRKAVNEENDPFQEGGETKNFFLKKTTRGSIHDLYSYTALLRYYKEPIVTSRNGVEVTYTYKIFVSRNDLPPAMQEMMQMKKAVRKEKKNKEANKEKKALAKEKAAEKKRLAKEKAAEKKRLAKEKAAEKKAKKATKAKTAKAPKAKTAKAPKAPKAPKTPKAPKAKKPRAPKVKGGCSGSCSMFY